MGSAQGFKLSLKVMISRWQPNVPFPFQPFVNALPFAENLFWET